MRRTVACSAIVTVLVATFYGPLFHLHAHSGELPLIHAHFLEIAHDDDSVVHMEAYH